MFENGKLPIALSKLVNNHCLGKNAGGIDIVSDIVLKLVNTIQTKGNIIMMEPSINIKYTNLFVRFFFITATSLNHN